jgi:MoxR-like ATPase
MSMNTGDETAIKEAGEILNRIDQAVGEVIVGQEILRRRLLTALITDSHILLEGVPGLAKTLSIKAFADAIHADFKRIQFTPDLLPADLVGTEIYRPQDGKFEVRRGPVFANFVLADEINRAPAKVQSALLETMQEKQVTIGEETFKLPDPFFVLATQNPIEQEGTYPLPEAQIDRFLFKVKVDYPSIDEEKEILNRVTSKEFKTTTVKPVASLSDIKRARDVCQDICINQHINEYIVKIIAATRAPKEYGLGDLANYIQLGASPRGTIALYLGARAEALLNGETFVTPQNVKDIALDALRHRIIPTYEAEAQGLSADDLIKNVLDGIEVP